MVRKVAILETDTPVDKIRERYNGGYGVLFQRLFEECGVASDVEFEYYQVVDREDNYPALDKVDTILITGSKHCCFGEDSWIQKLVEYTSEALKNPTVKVIGICFGHQIVARALGARTGKNPKGWEVASTEVTLTEAGKQLFGDIHGSDKMFISQMHRDIVLDIPEGTQLVAYNDVCEIQGLYIPHRLITFQGHPEYDGQTVRDIVDVRESLGVFSKEYAEECRAHSKFPQDGPHIARRFLQDLNLSR